MEAIERLPAEGQQAVWELVHEWEQKKADTSFSQAGLTFEHAGVWKDKIQILPGFDDPLDDLFAEYQ